MNLVEGKFELKNGIKVKLFDISKGKGEYMIELTVPSYTTVVVPFKELADFVDVIECLLDDNYCECEEDY